MKWSPYNHMFYSEKHGYLLYNIYSNTFFEFDRKTFSELEKIRESPDDHDYSNSMSLLLQLQSAGILIKDETSPQLELNLNNTVNRFAPRNLALTIAPTRDCNFECPYCYEEDRPSIYMSDETVEKTIRFIKKYRNFNRKNISWYGGEPLLCWDIIQRISDSLLGDDIDFSADIITNGYLLTPEKVRRLDELNIRLIQITLDGMEETHNTRRSPKDTKDSFERIIENMDYLIKNWKGRLSIRINVDRENHEEYHKVYTMLRERYSEYKNRLNIYPGIVKDYSGTCITASSCGLDRIEMQQFMFECY
ncbi:MAG: radical SAM protein, partial [Candidatus Muiribacteriaceae bacterium]